MSEAILLGSKLIEEPKSHITTHCAVGMGLAAIGKLSLGNDPGAVGDFDNDRRNCNTLLAEWPWLATMIPVACPDCGYLLGNAQGTRTHISNNANVVFHPFDAHVFGNRAMTIEQLADFIRSIEPPEPPMQGLTREEPCAAEMADQLSERGVL